MPFEQGIWSNRRIFKPTAAPFYQNGQFLAINIDKIYFVGDFFGFLFLNSRRNASDQFSCLKTRDFAKKLEKMKKNAPNLIFLTVPLALFGKIRRRRETATVRQAV